MHSLQRPDASIAEEEEDDDDDEEKEQSRKGGQLKEEELHEEEGSPMDETDETAKEETTTTELVTPTDEAPESEDKPLEVNRDQVSAVELQVRDESMVTEYIEETEDAGINTETPDSPELD